MIVGSNCLKYLLGCGAYIYMYAHIHTSRNVYVYVMEYYSAIKKNEIMSFAATWMNLEVIILNEVSHTKVNII